MSYCILYDSKFIKSKYGVIPLILSGSNNTYSIDPYSGRERKDKSWHILSGEKNAFKKERELYFSLSEIYQADSAHDFGLFKLGSSNNWIHHSDFPKWLEKEISKASTLEDLILTNPKETLVINIKNVVTRNEEYFTCRTTEELNKALSDYFRDGLLKPEKQMYIYFPTEQPLKKAFSYDGKPFVIKEKGSYVEKFGYDKINKNDLSSVSYTKDKSKAFVFNDFPEFLKFRNAENFRAFFDNISLVSPEIKKKPKNYVISCKDLFVEKQTKLKILLTSSINRAIGFSTLQEAEKYKKKLSERCKEEFTIVDFPKSN